MKNLQNTKQTNNKAIRSILFSDLRNKFWQALIRCQLSFNHFCFAESNTYIPNCRRFDKPQRTNCDKNSAMEHSSKTHANQTSLERGGLWSSKTSAPRSLPPTQGTFRSSWSSVKPLILWVTYTKSGLTHCQVRVTLM